MQLRRLGDLCFMFQLYEQAYNVYHTLKKDFEGDKTWMYCAGSQVSWSLLDFQSLFCQCFSCILLSYLMRNASQYKNIIVDTIYNMV